jgi:hypothetical protein
MKFVEVASTDKLDEKAVKDQFGNATLHTWDTIVRFRIVGALQEFRFSWDDRSVASDDIKKRTKDFRLQTIDFDAIDQKIGKIVKDIEDKKLLSSLGGGTNENLENHCFGVFKFILLRLQATSASDLALDLDRRELMVRLLSFTLFSFESFIDLPF